MISGYRNKTISYIGKLFLDTRNTIFAPYKLFFDIGNIFRYQNIWDKYLFDTYIKEWMVKRQITESIDLTNKEWC